MQRDSDEDFEPMEEERRGGGEEDKDWQFDELRGRKPTGGRSRGGEKQ